MPKFGFTSLPSRSFRISTAYSLQLTAFAKSHFADEVKLFIRAPAFFIGCRWKDLFDLVKKTLRHSCRSKRYCQGECVARQRWLSTYRRAGFTTAYADMASPLALGRRLYILGSVLRTERCPGHNRKVSRCFRLRQILRTIGI